MEKVINNNLLAKEIPPEFIDQCLNANELGDGMLFAALHKDMFISVAGAKRGEREWYYWGGHYWKLDEVGKADGAVENVAMCYLREAPSLEEIKKASDDQKEKLKDRRKLIVRRVDRLRSQNGVNKCLNMAAIGDHALTVTRDQLDNNPWILGCDNGVVDLRNGRLRAGKPGDLITKASPAEYLGLDAKSLVWDQFLNDITDGRQDVVDYLQKTLGYAITGLSDIHDFYCWTGKGRNGKGILIEAVAQVLGPLAAPIPAEMLLAQPISRAASAASPDIMALKGLRLAYASETDEGRKFSSSRVKWLTGGDYLTGRWPWDKYPVMFRPSHTLILLTNHKPRAQADDYAFWERCRLINFPLSFVNNREPDVAQNERKADPHLSKKLEKAAPAILAWLIQGCLKWQKDDHLKPPAYVSEATMEYRREEDIVQEWLDDRCSREPEGQMRASEAYEDFKAWYEENVGRKCPSQKFFGKQLQRFAPRVKDYRGRFYQGWVLES